jgi:RNA polymerase sigma factor (sigma-70 family)
MPGQHSDKPSQDTESQESDGLETDRRDADAAPGSAPVTTQEALVTPSEARGGAGPTTFSVQGLSSPDETVREREWLLFHASFYEKLIKAFAGSEPDRDRREDLVQQIFFRAWRAVVINGRPLESSEAALPWLKKIGKRLLYDTTDSRRAQSRMMGTHMAHMMADESLQTHAENPLERLSAEDPYEGDRFPVDAEKFRAQIALLSERDQTILRLRTDNELDWDAVGQAVGMTGEGARQRFHRIRDRLQRSFEED